MAGATTGYSTLWLALISTPMMSVIQGMCARIAMVNGEGLAAIVRKALPPWLAYALAGLVIVANTFNVGADIGGMAAAAELVVPIPVDALVFLFGIGLIAVQTWLSYSTIERIFKWLTLSLFAYVVTAFVVRPPWGDILLHFAVPRIHLDAAWLATVVGVLGTTITPYLFFWQSALMVEEEKKAGKTTLRKRRGTNAKDLAAMHADVNAGMIFSNLVAFFIIVTTAATLGAHGKHDIQTAKAGRRGAAALGRTIRFAALHARHGRHRNIGGTGAGDVVGVRRRRDLRFPRRSERVAAARAAVLRDYRRRNPHRNRDEPTAGRRD